MPAVNAGTTMLDPATTPRFPNREMRYTFAPPSPLEGAHGGELRAALDELHAAFAGAPLAVDFEGCPHCFMHGVLAIPTEHWTQRRVAAVRAVLQALLVDACARDDEYRAESVETLQAAVP